MSDSADSLLESRLLLSAAGLETLVNSHTLGSQVQPAIASDADGDYVVVWASQQDGSSYGIYAQRFNAAGVPQGSEFRVNTHTTNSQSHPEVAMDAVGNFVVVWNSDGQDGSDIGVYAQRYDASGTPLGGEFRVNTETNGAQRDPHVAIDADGDAVVVWYSDGQDGGGFGVYGQRFNSSGFQGGEFLVNTTTGGNQALADVAIDTNGNFVVAWHSFGQDGSGYGIYAQRFDASGVAQGVEFRVNTTTANQQTRPSVGMDENGDFVVAWESTAQDGSSDGIYAQRFTSTGIFAGSEFLVNTYTTAAQRNPSVSMDASGDFVVVWESYAQDGDFEGIYAQRYNSIGTPRGSEFRVNSTTNEVQNIPVVTLDSDGDFVIAWESFSTDGSGYGIYTQRFRENHLEYSGIWRSGQFYLDS
ncbi:MAG: hypothetical protein KDA68_20015, partial [Planctomycetaceae bacterium]|nr:hypothetical protein [Planctomycetaceae bacterium]